MLVGWDYPTFVQIGSSVGVLQHFQYFPTWRPSAIFNFKNFNIWTRECHWGICCCVPSFIKTGWYIRPPDAHYCWMFNAPLLGDGCCYGNHIMADRSETWLDATTQVSFQSVHWQSSYGISNIFQLGGRRPFWILKILIFNHVVIITVLICCCLSYFIKIG